MATKTKKAAAPKAAAPKAAAKKPKDDFSNVHMCTQMVLDDPVTSIAMAQSELASNIPVTMLALTPAEAAGTITKKWAPGRTLHVRYLDGDPAVQARVTAIAQEWERHVNLDLVFDNSPNAEIRVTFTRGGSWSYVGTDCLGIAANMATMQYGWLTAATAEWEYRRVVLHEFGHALGLQHEHQNPTAGIPWDKPKVYDYYARTQNPPWTKAQVDSNLFNALNTSTTNYTSFDRDSIMEYSIPAALTIGGYHVEGNEALSRVDRDFMGRWYQRPRLNIGVADSVIVARESQHLDLFWIAPNGAVMSAWWHEGRPWSPPFAIAGAGSARPGSIAAVARNSDHLDIFWVAPNGAVMSAWWHESLPWSVPFAISGPGTADAGAIAVVARESGHLDIFWVAVDGSVMSAWWHEGRPWSAPFSIAGTDSAEPGGICAVARTNNHLDVFWVNQDYAVASAWWHEGQPWSAPFTLTGNGAAEEGSLAVVARLSSHLDLFWVSADGSVMSAWWHEGQTWSAPFVLAGRNSAMRPGALAVTARQSNHLDVFWSSPDGALMTAWWHDGQPWSGAGRVSGFGAVEERSITAVARLSNHLDVFWVGPGGEVASIWWHDRSPWSPPFLVAGANSSAV